MEIENTQQSIDFPEEIIEQILSRLEVKSLLKFRCVSKLWCSLIYSKHLILTQLQVSKRSKNSANQELLVKRRYGEKLMWLCSLLSGKPEFRSLELSPPIHDKIRAMHLVGCSNGLVCVLLKRNKTTQFMLWNPSTRTSKKLPYVSTTIMGCDIIECYGFGWDESSGDYKVIAISSVKEQKYACIIYSLKTDSWKQKKACESDHSLPPLLRPNCEQGLLASGKLHWERGYRNATQWKIVAFDLKREVFEIVKKPSSYCGVCSFSCTYSKIGILGESLIVTHYHPYRYCGAKRAIWAMKEYGVQQSWVKIISIDRFLEPIWTHPDPDIYYCVSTNGEILMLIGRTILITEFDPNCFRDRDTSSYTPDWKLYPGESPSYDSFVYIESLVSPVARW